MNSFHIEVNIQIYFFNKNIQEISIKRKTELILDMIINNFLHLNHVHIINNSIK